MALLTTALAGLAGAAMSAVGGGLSAYLTNKQQERNNDLQNSALALQAQQFLYQQQYDEWAKRFAETQRQDSLNAFNKQYQLAQSPISTLVKDGSSVGVNPMAALGQNVGSASFSGGSAPSSSVGTGFGVSPVSDSLGTSLMHMITGLAETSMNNQTQQKISNDTLQNQRIMQQEQLAYLRDKQSQDYYLGTESNERAKENVAIQSRLAKVSENNLVRLSKKDAHDMLVDDRKLLLQRAQDRFERKMATKHFEFEKARYREEFKEQKRQFEKRFDQVTNENLDRWEHMDKYARMRMATAIAHEINADFRSIFGIGSSEPEYDAYQATRIGF